MKPQREDRGWEWGVFLATMYALFFGSIGIGFNGGSKIWFGVAVGGPVVWIVFFLLYWDWRRSRYRRQYVKWRKDRLAAWISLNAERVGDGRFL